VGIALYEAVDDGADFRLLSMNPSAERITRVRADDVLGKRITEAFPGAASMGIVDALRRVHRTGRAESLPPPACENDALRACFRHDLSRLHSGHLMAVYVDTAPEVRAESELEDGLTRYDLLTRALTDGIYDWDVTNNRLYLSPVWKAQVGYADDELANTFETWLTLLHPQQRDRVLRKLQNFISGNTRSWDLEFQLRHKDGYYVWIQSRGTPIRDADTGEVTRILGVHIDIDQKKREQFDAQRERRSLEAVFDAIPDLFFLLDGEGRIEDYHAGNRGELYRDPVSFVGEPIETMLPEHVRDQVASALQEARISGELVAIEYELLITGRDEHYEARIRHLDDNRFALIIRRITQRKMTELAVEERVRELEGLYQLHRITQATDSRPDLVRRVTAAVARAFDARLVKYIGLNIDDISSEYGACEDAPSLFAPIYDGETTRGHLRAQYGTSGRGRKDQQSFLNAAALTLGLWLRSENARIALETYEEIVSNTQDQLALVDATLCYRLANKAYAECIGWEPADLVGRPILQVLAPAGFGPSQEQHLRDAMAGRVVQYREWRSTPDGRRFMNVLYSPHRRDEAVAGVIISVHDITDLHDAQAQLRRAARVFSDSGEAVFMTSPDGTITDVNPAFTKIAGFTAEQCCGEPISIIASPRQPREYLLGVLENVAESGRWRGEVWCRRSNGEVFACLMTVSPVEDEAGTTAGYVGVFSDITPIKENEQRLEILANHDPLTGLANRAQLTRYLNSRISRAAEQRDSFTVMFIDLDRFKIVNDTLGHSAGDRLLCEVTGRLQEALRASDLLARIGGDEFVAVVSGITARGNVSVVADKILDVLTAPFCIRGQRVQVSGSIGICFFPEDGRDAETLLRNADTAMYEAKDAGRAGWRCYTQEMTEHAQRHMQILSDLGGARDRGEHYLVYQPKVELDSQRMVGLEILLRWRHPTLGEIKPGEFIPVARHGGLIRSLDRWVLRESCSQFMQWRRAGIDPPRVSVNISSTTLDDPDFADWLEKELEDAGMPGNGLGLDIHEEALNPEHAERDALLSRLDALGVRLAVDDFGAGYTSLAYLTRLPFRELKLDATLVADLGSNPRTQAIVSAIAGMCRALSIDVVAEGVETEEQAEHLVAYAPLLAQGYHYARPQPATAVESLLPRQPRESSAA